MLLLQYYNLRVRRRQLNFLLYGQSGELFRVGWSEKKNNTLSFRVSTSKNKNADTFETNHISLLRDVKCTKFLFFMYFIAI